MGSAEREAERLDARIKKLDLELAVLDLRRLPDQLIRSLFGDDALALRVDISATPRRLPVNPNTVAHRGPSPSPGRTHHEIDVASVEAIRDAPVRLLQDDRLATQGPVPRHRPFVQSQPRRVPYEVLALLRAEIGLWRAEVVPVRCCLNTRGIDRHELTTEAAGTGFPKHLLNHPLGLIVRAFTEMREPDCALRVDQIERRPV